MVTRTYTHGGKNIEFHFCEKCNGLMFWWPCNEKRIPRMAINSRMVVDRKELEGVEVKKGYPQERRPSPERA